MGKIKNLTREIRTVIKHPVVTTVTATKPKARMWEMADPLFVRDQLRKDQEEKK